MAVFTLDIGTGTQDFLLYSGNNVKNNLKMILPSPTKIVARKINNATKLRKNLLLKGYTMGGGPCKFAIKKHLDAGLKVYAEEKAALTFADNLDKVRQMGIDIVEEDFNLEDAIEIELKDVDFNLFMPIIEQCCEEKPEKYVIAVQDHGFSPLESNRVFRFRIFENFLKKDGYLTSFLYKSDEIPEFFNRMLSVVETIEKYDENAEVYVIDTVFAAIAGCMLDVIEFPALLLNFGNSHIIGAVVDKDGFILSLFEHHTNILMKRGLKGIENFINDFLKGEITNEDVLKDNGHGAFVREVVDVKEIVMTGPNAIGNYKLANPIGDIMIVGNLGMLNLLSRKIDFNFEIL